MSFNKLLLDPPRSGASFALKSLGLSTVERIVYVSCNFKTLIDDIVYLKIQCATKFRLEKIGVLDMFPHTKHVEVMALLVKVK